MKIVLLYDQLKLGGTEKLFVTIANLLHQHQHEVSVVLINAPAVLDDTLDTGIRIIYLNRKNKLGFRPMKQLASICKVADVIHVHTYYNWRYLFFCSFINSRGKAKVVLHEHSDLKLINNIDRFILPRLDACIAVNEQQAITLTRMGIASGKIFVIPNIVEQQQQIKPRTTRSHKILMVGNIRREKNYELAIEIIHQSKVPLHLDIYGNINDSVYHLQLVQLIEEKQLGARVHFVSNETNIAKHYDKYDLALHTANNETGPLVVLEYLSAGLPFLSAASGQSHRMIEPHLADVIVRSFNVNDWVQSLKDFYLMSLNEQQELSKRLLQTAVKVLDKEVYYQQLIEVYKFMLAPKHASV